MKTKYFDMIAIDLDGTLIDSVGDLHQAIISMQQSMNLTLASENDVRMWVGNGIERLVHRALTRMMDLDAEENLFNNALDSFIESYHQTNGKFSNLYEHVEASLQWMQRQNMPIICVTNKARQFAEPVLEHHNIAHYFEHLIAGDDVKEKKPHPEALLKSAQLSNVRPENCLMIGDSISDIKAAKAAEFTSVCVSYGYNHGVNIRDISGPETPNLVIDSFAELKHALPTLSSVN